MNDKNRSNAEVNMIWILVYGVCSTPGKICTTVTHSTYEKQERCIKVRDEQNRFWQKHKLKAKVYCIESSIVLEARK